MKKLALIIAVAGIVGLSSCSKKCYTCTVASVETEYCEDTYTDDQIDAAKEACELVGTWE